jgi:hypothetical protein
MTAPPSAPDCTVHETEGALTCSLLLMLGPGLRQKEWLEQVCPAQACSYRPRGRRQADAACCCWALPSRLRLLRCSAAEMLHPPVRSHRPRSGLLRPLLRSRSPYRLAPVALLLQPPPVPTQGSNMCWGTHHLVTRSLESALPDCHAHGCPAGRNRTCCKVSA